MTGRTSQIKMKISTFIFDLDGTLTDPLSGMANSINYALEVHGFRTRDEQELAQFVGPPLEGTLAILCGSDDDSLIARLVKSYRERYLDTGYAQNTVYDGIRTTLSTLQQNDIRMGVCTSKPATTARKILELFELNVFFEFISGGDIGVKKSQQLEQLLRADKIDRHALMIGDRSVDITAAKSNELRSASVAWGYGSSEELQQAASEFHFSSPRDILRLAECSE